MGLAIRDKQSDNKAVYDESRSKLLTETDRARKLPVPADAAADASVAPAKKQ
jgi:hypothetical protein